MVAGRLTRSKKELLERIKKDVDGQWNLLTKWEKSFVEDILSIYERYGDNMFISDYQIDRLIEISEKIL